MMEPTTTVSLIIFGAIAVSRSLIKLVETVGAHVGLRYEPTHIRNMADAQRYARVQEELTNTDIADIRQRMTRSTESRELRRQANREKVVHDTAGFLPNVVSDSPVDDDWTAQFFDYCQDVSDEQLQSIWSQILAGEVAEPGSFSLRTLHAVKMLRKDDAKLFTSCCRFRWCEIDEPVSFSVTAGDDLQFWAIDKARRLEQIYRDEGLTGLTRLHLQSLNLIQMADPSKPLSFTSSNEHPARIAYHGSRYAIRFANQVPRIRPLQLPADIFTDIGCELAPISGATIHEEYHRLVVEQIRDHGFRVEALAN